LRRRQLCCGASDQPPIFPEIASFGASFGSASDLRRLPLLRTSLRTNFQSFVEHLIFQLTFRPTSDSRRKLRRPVLPWNPTPGFRQRPRLAAFLSDCLQLALDIESPSSAFQSMSDSSSDIASLTSLSDQLPTCVGAPSSNSALRFDFQLALAASSSSFPFDSASDLRRLPCSQVLSAINFRFLSEFESSGGAVDQLPTCVDYSSIGGASDPTFRLPS